MSKVQCELTVRGNSGSAWVRAVISPETRFSLIRSDLSEKVNGPRIHRLTKPVRIRVEKDGPMIVAHAACILMFEMKGESVDSGFFVADDLPFDLIIGDNIIRDWGIKVDPAKGDYEIVPDPDRFLIGVCD